MARTGHFIVRFYRSDSEAGSLPDIPSGIDIEGAKRIARNALLNRFQSNDIAVSDRPRFARVLDANEMEVANFQIDMTADGNVECSEVFNAQRP
jgi:hypothetical protein